MKKAIATHWVEEPSGFVLYATRAGESASDGHRRTLATVAVEGGEYHATVNSLVAFKSRFHVATSLEGAKAWCLGVLREYAAELAAS